MIPIGRFCLVAFLVLCTLQGDGKRLHAQDLSRDTQASDVELQSWLASGDPRLISWAATLARERHDAVLIARLPAWLHQSALVADYDYAPKQKDRRAYEAVLDALVRGDEHTAVDFLDLQELARSFPVQAFLLTDRLPADKQLAILREWFLLADLSIPYSELAHLAAMRLAQWNTPVPGFAARVLTQSEEQLTIVLQLEPTELSGIGTGACSDSMARQPEPGWPVVYVPMVEEGPNSTSGRPLVTLDDDRVSYRWVEENSPGGTCAALTRLGQSALYRILAHWLRESAMEWQPKSTVPVIWSNQKRYEAAIGRIVDEQQQAFANAVEVLVRQGRLSSDEASFARPGLTIRVVCNIHPCPVANAATAQPLDFRYSAF